MAEHGCKSGTDGCTRLITQGANVQLPLDVNAYAELKGVRTKCCGDPEVQVVEQCCGCKLIVKQKLAVSIAIEYGTDVTAEDCKTDCSDHVSV